jgi:hypothetical protein
MHPLRQQARRQAREPAGLRQADQVAPLLRARTMSANRLSGNPSSETGCTST